MDNKTEEKFESFSEFYPYYLSEHGDKLNRRLHFTGLLLALLILVVSIITGKWALLILMPVFGYGLAWFGHFYFEKNKPAAFHGLERATCENEQPDYTIQDLDELVMLLKKLRIV